MSLDLLLSSNLGKVLIDERDDMIILKNMVRFLSANLADFEIIYNFLNCQDKIRDYFCIHPWSLSQFKMIDQNPKILCLLQMIGIENFEELVVLYAIYCEVNGRTLKYVDEKGEAVFDNTIKEMIESRKSDAKNVIECIYQGATISAISKLLLREPCTMTVNVGLKRKSVVVMRSIRQLNEKELIDFTKVHEDNDWWNYYLLAKQQESCSFDSTDLDPCLCPMEIAAFFGKADLIKFLHLHGVGQSSQIIRKALEGGNFNLAKRLVDSDCPIEPGLIQVFVKACIKKCRYLEDEYMDIDKNEVTDYIKYIYGKLKQKYIYNIYQIRDAITFVEDSEFVRFLLENAIERNRSSDESIEWLICNDWGSPSDEYLIEIVKLLREFKYDWRPGGCFINDFFDWVWFRDIEYIKIICELDGFEPRPKDFSHVVTYGNISCVEYLFSKKCPFEQDMLAATYKIEDCNKRDAMLGFLSAFADREKLIEILTKSYEVSNENYALLASIYQNSDATGRSEFLDYLSSFSCEKQIIQLFNSTFETPERYIAILGELHRSGFRWNPETLIRLYKEEIEIQGSRLLKLYRKRSFEDTNITLEMIVKKVEECSDDNISWRDFDGEISYISLVKMAECVFETCKSF